MVYLLRIYVNADKSNDTYCLDINDAVKEANHWEDMGYIVEIFILDNPRIMSRAIWRESRVE